MTPFTSASIIHLPGGDSAAVEDGGFAISMCWLESKNVRANSKKKFPNVIGDTLKEQLKFVRDAPIPVRGEDA